MSAPRIAPTGVLGGLRGPAGIEGPEGPEGPAGYNAGAADQTEVANWIEETAGPNAVSAALSTSIDAIAVPRTIIVAGPLPSGDMTGATDTAAVSALLDDGALVVLPDVTNYYFNAVLPLHVGTGNGMRMGAETLLHWVGAAGGAMFATEPFAGANQDAWRGTLEGGVIRYPYDKIVAGSPVVYIAQPYPRWPITTKIDTNVTVFDAGSHPVIAGSVGYDLDGNTSPGPFTISAAVIGQFDTQILVRTSHVNAIACQGAYGNDLIRVDDDSLSSAVPPVDVQIVGPHAFKNQGSVVRLTRASQVTTIGGLNEIDGGDTAVFLHADSTFNGFALVLNPYAFGNARLKHYGTGSVRLANQQDGYDATFTGHASGVPIPRSQVQKTITGPFGDWSNSSTGSDLAAVVVGPIASSIGGRFKVRYIGNARNSLAANGFVVRVYQCSAVSVGNAIPGGATQIAGLGISSVTTADEGVPVVLETELTGQSGSAFYFCVGIRASGSGTASAQGRITVEVY